MEDRRTRTDGAKKRHSESVGGLLRSCSAEEQTGRLPDFVKVAWRFAGAWVRVSARLRAESRGVNELNFNSLPMLGRSLSKGVQGSEGIRQNLSRVGRHAKHDFQRLEDGDKADTRAVRVAVCAMTACRGLIVKAVGRNGGISAKTAAAGKSGGIVEEAFAAGMRRLKIARAERGVRGNFPCLLLQALPRARAARRSKSNAPAPGGERRKGVLCGGIPAAASGTPGRGWATGPRPGRHD